MPRPFDWWWFYYRWRGGDGWEKKNKNIDAENKDYCAVIIIMCCVYFWVEIWYLVGNLNQFVMCVFKYNEYA